MAIGRPRSGDPPQSGFRPDPVGELAGAPFVQPPRVRRSLADRCAGAMAKQRGNVRRAQVEVIHRRRKRFARRRRAVAV